jgi:hypothetical protein
MTRHGLTHGPRFRSGYHALRHGEASARLGDPMARASRFELPTLHSDGRDHIVGGGGAPAGRSPDTMIALADGTRITFAKAAVSV